MQLQKISFGGLWVTPKGRHPINFRMLDQAFNQDRFKTRIIDLPQERIYIPTPKQAPKHDSKKHGSILWRLEHQPKQGRNETYDMVAEVTVNLPDRKINGNSIHIAEFKLCPVGKPGITNEIPYDIGYFRDKTGQRKSYFQSFNPKEKDPEQVLQLLRDVVLNGITNVIHHESFDKIYSRS